MATAADVHVHVVVDVDVRPLEELQARLGHARDWLLCETAWRSLRFHMAMRGSPIWPAEIGLD